MSDLISRNELYTKLGKEYNKGYMSWGSNEIMKEIVTELPSVDIMECARAMKEYCEKYAENCEGCPFKSKKVDVWCELGSSTLPYEWDLPEGEKE